MDEPFSTRVIGLVWLGVFCLLAMISAEQLITPVTPIWDIAADMLLQNRIRDEGMLLTGHYSRWEFNHPGPFWFYYNHVIEWLLSPFELSRVQVWRWGSLLLNSVLVSGTAIGLTALLRPPKPLLFTCSSAALLIAFVGPELTGIWMPERMIAPYAAFLVTLALLSQGHIRILPVVILLVCVLIHGYVTMPILTLPFLAWGCWRAWRKQGGWGGVAAYRTVLIGSALIIVCFILPLVVDYTIHEPSNIHRILRAQASFKQHDLPGLGEVLTFIRQLLLRDRLWQWVGITMLLLLFWRSPTKIWQRPAARTILLLLLAATVLMLAYYSRTPAPLFAFIAKFYLAVPPLILAVSLLQFGQRPWLTAGVILLMLAPHLKPTPIEQGWEIQQAAQQLIDNQTGLPIRLDYEDHFQWTYVAGLLLELDRLEVAACTTWRHMAFLYTDAKICAEGARPTYTLVAGKSCSVDCLFSSEAFDIQPFRLPELLPETTVQPNSSAVFFSGWHSPETEFRWTDGTESDIQFRVADGSFSGHLKLVIDTLGEQSLTLLLNGRAIYHSQLHADQTELRVDFDPALLLRNEINTLRLKTPAAEAPGSADRRILAVALRNLTIE